ncbi:MAG TPA: amidase domain-containing protein [Patescibacteria group bacterium]|nr:amidase domain-containing protein [Patescibacteria group bacterium]
MEKLSIHFMELPPDAQQAAQPTPAVSPDTIREAVRTEIATRNETLALSEQPGLPPDEVPLFTSTERPSLLTKIGASRFGRLALKAAIGLGIAGGVLAVEAAPAHADSGQEYTVTHDASGGVYARTGPHVNETQRISGDGIYPGDVVRLICGVTNGDPVGPYNNTTWHLLTDESRPSEGQFWENDHYISTPDNPSHLAPNEQNCGTQQARGSASNNLQPAAPLQGNETVPAQTNIYDRQRSVAWAIANGKDQPPTDGSCDWFVSNALWQGGLAKTQEWTSDGYLGGELDSDYQTYIKGHQSLPGTIVAWKAPLLLKYLLATYPHSDLEPIDFSPKNNDPKDAQIGDLVFYDWGQGENISHVAIVTKIESSGYLDVTDWSTQDDGTLPSPVSMRGVTYSAVHHEWLQKRYPNVRAYLLHINTKGSPGNP